MKHKLAILKCLAIILALFLAATGSAQDNEPPVVEAAWADPDLATYGDTITFSACVSDADGTIASVWVLYQAMPLWEMTQSAEPGLYTYSWTVPDAGFIPPGEYQLDVIAVDDQGGFSDRFPVWFIITDRDPRIPRLISPRNRAWVGCDRPLIFSWSVVPHAIGYGMEITMPDGDVISTGTAGLFNILGIMPKILHAMPDGEYYWKVRAIFDSGEGEWSEEWMFTKDCEHGPHFTINGVVRRIDPEARTFILELTNANREDNGVPNPDPNDRRMVRVQVTDDTEIYDEDGNAIGFDDLELGHIVSVFGYFDRPVDETGDNTWDAVFIAERINVRGHVSDYETIRGVITEISYERRAFVLVSPGDEPGAEPQSTPVYVPEDARISKDGRPARFEDLRNRDRAACTGEYRDLDGTAEESSSRTVLMRPAMSR